MLTATEHTATTNTMLDDVMGNVDESGLTNVKLTPIYFDRWL